jgi:L-serine dehydratase
VDLGEDAHPNTAILTLRRADSKVRVRGASIGGGRIEVTEIDGFPVSLSGNYHTLVVVARDEPGTIMTISGLCASQGINLATMRVDRTGRLKDALMTIEADDPIPDLILEELREFEWLHWVRRVEKIS